MRGRAKRDSFAIRHSPRQRGANPRDGQFGRANHKFVGQPQYPKSLAAKPNVPRGVRGPLFLVPMARPIDLDDESPLEANEIDKEVSQRDLSLKFSPFASPVANRAPN